MLKRIAFSGVALGIAVIVLSACGGQQPTARSEKAAVPPAATSTPGKTVPTTSPPAASKQEKTVPAAPSGSPAVEQKAAAESGPNLIPNGSFANWPQDIRIPAGWSHGYYYPTVDEMPSTIARAKGGSPESGPAVEQTWKVADGADAISRMFYVKVDGLEPKVTYRLSFKAQSWTKNHVVVLVCAVEQVGKADSPSLLSQDDKFKSVLAVDVTPSDGLKEYSATFELPQSGSIAINTACGGSDFPATAIWSDFRLTRAR